MLYSPHIYLLVVLAGAGAGCSATSEPLTCTLQLNSTIVVDVLDVRTGEAAALGSTVVVRGPASFYDSVTVTKTLFRASTAYIAWEDKTPVGHYDVTVRKAGYREGTRSGEVTGDQCHRGPGPGITVDLVPN